MADGDRVLPSETLEDIQAELADLEAVQDAFDRILRVATKEHARMMRALELKLKKANALVEKLKKELADTKAK